MIEISIESISESIFKIKKMLSIIHENLYTGILTVEAERRFPP
jgi:hypothetical protein